MTVSAPPYGTSSSAARKMLVPALSPQHARTTIEMSAGPVSSWSNPVTATDPGRLAEFRREYEGSFAHYFETTRSPGLSADVALSRSDPDAVH